MVANCDHLRQLRFSPVNPYAFTGHGTIMVVTILNTPVAVEASVAVVRPSSNYVGYFYKKGLAKRLNELEAKYDHQFKIVFETIRELMQLPGRNTKRPRIGYRRSNEKD